MLLQCWHLQCGCWARQVAGVQCRVGEQGGQGQRPWPRSRTAQGATRVCRQGSPTHAGARCGLRAPVPPPAEGPPPATKAAHTAASQGRSSSIQQGIR